MKPTVGALQGPATPSWPTPRPPRPPAARVRCARRRTPADGPGRALLAAGRDDEADAEFHRAAGLRPATRSCASTAGGPGPIPAGGCGAGYFDEAVADRPTTRCAGRAGRFLEECGESERADADFEQAAVTAQDDPNVFLGGWWVAGPYPDASEPDTTRGPATPCSRPTPEAR